MSTVKQLEPKEVRDIMLKVQRYHSLESIRKIIKLHPDRIKEFGFDQKSFQNIEKDINIIEEECRAWWENISSKYNLPINEGFQVDYESCTLELI